MIVYLDWNVLNKIEQKESLVENEMLVYSNIEYYILSNKIDSPYSNAHLHDLIRGYKKNSSFIDGHLDIISKITKNLCVCQYWGEKDVKFHFRSAREFFYSAIEEKQSESDNFDELVSFDSDPLATEIWKLKLEIMKTTPISENFKQIYKADPIFNIIYPKTKIEMNEYALACDIYNFSIMVNRDYSLYKALRRFINTTISKYKKDKQIILHLKKGIIEQPKYLNIDTLIENYTMENRYSITPRYDRLFDVFFKYDLKGYKSDDQFSNMIDDCLHTYYGSYCDYFITNDDRCHYKAIKTYEKLGIKTKVMTAYEFANTITK